MDIIHLNSTPSHFVGYMKNTDTGRVRGAPACPHMTTGVLSQEWGRKFVGTFILIDGKVIFVRHRS